MTSHSTRRQFLLTIFAMGFLAANMRAPIVALGPIAPVVQEALDISQIQIGWLGSIPVIMFTIGAFISSKLGKRFGIENMLMFAIALLSFGIVVRVAVVDWWWFLVGTTLLSLAISFINTLAAPAIKRLAPDNIPLVTGVLGFTMAIVAGTSAGMVMPLTEQFGWRWALGCWAVLSAIALFIWMVLAQTNHSGDNFTDTSLADTSLTNTSKDASKDASTNTLTASIWTIPMAWYVAIFMGLQSLLFYTFASFLPSMLIDRGLTPIIAGQMVSVFLFVAPLSILFLTWAMRHHGYVRHLAVASALLNLLGVVGVAYLSPSWSWLWLASTGFGGTMLYTLCTMLISMRTYTSEQASDLSSMAQTVGYFIAIVGPLGTGWLHEITNSWALPLHLLSLLMFFNLGFAYLASRPLMIDGSRI